MMLRTLSLALVAGNALALDLPATLDWSGRVSLTLPVAGVIEQVNVQAGQTVKKDTLLATLNPTLFKAGVAETRADLDRLIQEEADATRDLDRVKELYARTVSSTTELDAAKLRHARALRRRDPGPLRRTRPGHHPPLPARRRHQSRPRRRMAGPRHAGPRPDGRRAPRRGRQRTNRRSDRARARARRYRPRGRPRPPRCRHSPLRRHLRRPNRQHSPSLNDPNRKGYLLSYLLNHYPSLILRTPRIQETCHEHLRFGL
ncbi:MAG: hypothetical protein COW48_11270 [Hydrogenophilales bacterium CG17_big_fil_post_rev_8_21_14_2_50_63_12]|nr:MAG: hypothetical protein COW48_11270 [Hydrogenophilales bacterium CG17_big_fil_post_rev_8_21_14_2_50_63_12]PIX96124.1 MAG: hypothetical protein COZ24_12005 [Hydrogenophilales bacterium CG_4_10_14_3_um_filter_63_21]PJB04614.1 MAG: hypothetical protein CO126_05035 [Hydrogenophilales bacterium CG_4_9_14_3_um_filter_63_34]